MSKKKLEKKELADYSIPLGREIARLQKIEDFKGIDCILVFGNGSMCGRKVKKRTLFGNPIFEYVSIDWGIEMGDEKTAPEPKIITNKEEARRYLTNFVREMELEQYEVNTRIIKTPWGYHHIFNKSKYTLDHIIDWMKRGCRNEDPKIVGTTTIDKALERFLLDHCPEVKKKLKAFEVIKSHAKENKHFKYLLYMAKYWEENKIEVTEELLYNYDFPYTKDEFFLLREVLQ